MSTVQLASSGVPKTLMPLTVRRKRTSALQSRRIEEKKNHSATSSGIIHRLQSQLPQLVAPSLQVSASRQSSPTRARSAKQAVPACESVWPATSPSFQTTGPSHLKRPRRRLQRARLSRIQNVRTPIFPNDRLPFDRRPALPHHRPILNSDQPSPPPITITITTALPSHR